MGSRIGGIGLLLCLISLGSAPAATASAATYWRTPVPAQVPAPPVPEACGSCHIEQYRDWSGSRHAHAFSPGLLGQLVDLDSDDVAACLACHAPLAEQQSPLDDAALFELALDMQGYRPNLPSRHGVYCAACHLRDGLLHAPRLQVPRPLEPAHTSVRIEPLMQDSLFCAACHQFDNAVAINGKPIQNTYAEWLDSPFAADGVTCQGCHLPDARHLFRGIHDAEMVRQGLTIRTETTEQGARLIVESTAVGHDFPTYIVPRVRLIAIPSDAAGTPLANGTRERVLQRLMSVERGRWIEHSDTRLRPGETVSLELPWRDAGRCAQGVRFRILVEPEWYYRARVYPSLMDELEDGPARALIVRAMEEAARHDFVLFDEQHRSTIDCDGL